MSYSLSDFDYELPDRLIAQEPAQPRDHARLLVYDRQTGNITDDHFYNLPEYLPEQTRMVLNNSKVEKCRLLFDDGSKELFLLERINDKTARALVRPGKKFRQDNVVNLTEDISVTVVDIDDEGIRTIEFNPSLGNKVYNPHKHTPFPPYIEQDESLAKEYQTVYASDKNSGASKAAPTAGLHFTDELLKEITDAGTPKSEVTLHVGLGTFAPVKADSIDEHTMHSEYFELTANTADSLNQADHITAVGTTSVRVLESCLKNQQSFKENNMDTDIFIRPGYNFKATDALITNFHLPKSTLLMLVSAFMGYEEMRHVYQHAIDEEYRFYSFGDAMLIL